MQTGSDDKQAWLWAGECNDPHPTSLRLDKPTSPYSDYSSAEGAKILLDQTSGRSRIFIARTNGSRTPIFVSFNEDVLTVSWKYENVVAGAGSITPNRTLCTKFITQGYRRYRDTIFEGIYSIWAGEAVVFDAEGIQFHECPVASIVVPGTFQVSARATEALSRLIRTACTPALASAERPLLELSGGYDSSCVGVAAKPLRDNWASYSVIQQGVAGRQQRKRRAELINLIGSKDFEIDYSAIPGPIEALLAAENRISALDDNHRAPCEAGLANHPEGPFDVVLTGVGGDELTMTDTFHIYDDEVPGTIANSASTAAAGRSDLFMRRGIWPLHPLTSQSVVDFCRALPQEIRDKRSLNTLMLARTGLSDGFLFSPYRENCGTKMLIEMLFTDFEERFRSMLVVDLQLYDVGSLLREIHHADFAGYTSSIMVQAWAVCKLEAVLQTYMTTKAGTTSPSEPPYS